MQTPTQKKNGLNTITCILFQLSTPVMSFPADGRVNYSILEKEEMKDEKEKQVDWNSGFQAGKESWPN